MSAMTSPPGADAGGRRSWPCSPSSPLLAAHAAAPGDATNMLEAVQNRGVLRVVSDPNFRPQSYYDQLIGRWRGFDVDVATEIARRLGVDVQFISGVFEDVQAGELAARVGSVASAR